MNFFKKYLITVSAIAIILTDAYLIYNYYTTPKYYLLDYLLDFSIFTGVLALHFILFSLIRDIFKDKND